MSLSRKLLVAYVADALCDEDKALVESHLQECNSCIEQMQELQRGNLREVELDFKIPSL